MQLVDAARGAATRLRALPADARVRIVAHLDADGISSAAIVLRALVRERRQFHVTYTAEHALGYFEGLDHEPYEANIFVDIGASVLPTIARLSGVQIVLDHHAPLDMSVEAPNLCVINPHMVGDDGVKDACGSTTALAFAVALSETNWDLAPHALVGAFGDRQERGGFTGWNGYVLSQAVERGLLVHRKHLAIPHGPLVDVLRYPRPPWDRARIEDPAQFLHDHGIPAEATVLELPPAEAETLASAMVARLLAAGLAPYMVKELFADVPHSVAHDGVAIPRLVNLTNAAAREGDPGLGLAALLGDINARRDLEALEGRYHQTIRAILAEIQTAGVQALRGLQVFQVPQVAYVGDVCGLAMETVLARSRATLAFAPLGDHIRCSARGTVELVAKGLDLGLALRQAATSVGGIGGGHTIASGATVPRGRFDEFLARADDIIARQLGVWP